MKTVVVLLLIVGCFCLTAYCQLWQIGQLSIPGSDNCRLVRAYGDYCFYTKYASFLTAVNVTNPSAPFSQGTINLYLHGYVTIAENTLYVSGGSFTNSVFIVNITNPSNLILVNQIFNSGNSADLEARGNYLYICSYGNGVYIYDITNRLAPVLANHITGTGSAYGLKLSGNYLYLGIVGTGLTIYDISNPNNPLYVSSCFFTTGSYPIVTKDDNYIYFASYTGGYIIIDVTNPQLPFIVNTVTLPNYEMSVGMANSRMFGCNSGEGVYMYDVGNPFNPNQLSHLPPYGMASRDITIADRYAYVAELDYLRCMEYAKPRDGYYTGTRTEYNFIDISATGTPWTLAPESFTTDVSIGFSFPFYDSTYTHLHICSNGFVAFNDYSPSYWDTPLPCDTQPNDIIAPLWDHFAPAGCVNVYTELLNDPTRFVIQFVNMPRVGTTEMENFEIILYDDGDISFQYPEIINASSATVGIENETGTRGTLVLHNRSHPLPDSIGYTFARIEGQEDVKFTGLEEMNQLEVQIPDEIQLSAYPNPFNPETTINFSLSAGEVISLIVYDIKGREIVSIAEGFHAPGTYRVKFDGGDLPTGIYFMNFRTKNQSNTEKLLLLK